MTLCACGCGDEVNSGRFLQGHGRKGHTHTQQSKDAIGKAHEKYPTEQLKRAAKLEEKRKNDMLRRQKPKRVLPNGINTNVESKMVTNVNSSVYIGCYVSERVIHNLFKESSLMQHGNHGFDIITKFGYRIDVKSSATWDKANRLTFRINENDVADCFALIAFDSVHSDPIRLWLIPGHVINNYVTLTIREKDVYKWEQYEYNIDEVVSCYREIMPSA